MLEMVRRKVSTLNRVVAVVDLDGDSVGVVLLQVIPTMPFAVLGERRMQLPASDRSFEHSASRLAELLEMATNDLLTTIRGMSYVVDTVYVVLRLPWASTHLVRRAVYSGKEVPVTREFINTVAMNAISSDIVPSQDDFFEGRVMRVELNGYPTNDPLGKRARAINLTLLMSESAKRERDVLSAVLQRLFPVAQVEWRSGTRALVHAMRSRDESEKEYLFIEIGSYKSQLTLVQEGVITGHEVVPFGMHSFLQGGEVSEDTIRDVLDVHRVARHAPSIDSSVRAHIARKGEEAAAFFLPAMNALLAGHHVPDRIHVLAPEVSHAWFSHVLDRPECVQFKRNIGSCQIAPVNAAIFSPVFHSADAVKDPSLAVGCALVHNELLSRQ